LKETDNQHLVTISHELTRAAYSMSLNEKRVLLKAASKLDLYGGSDQLIEIQANDCADFYSMNSKSAYHLLASAVERLWDRTLVLKDGTRMRWVITCKYETGRILIQFHPDLNPHLLDLKEKFTRYLLSRAANFKLLYSWRIFELIMQYKSTGYLKISLDDFKRMLEIPKSYDKDFGKVREKVITPAINEIREKDGLKITWKPIKTGRSVTALEFKFPVELQKELVIDPIDNAYIEKHAHPGETYAQARKRLSEQREKEVNHT
jgi:plasmid replication initiation protein